MGASTSDAPKVVIHQGAICSRSLTVAKKATKFLTHGPSVEGCTRRSGRSPCDEFHGSQKSQWPRYRDRMEGGTYRYDWNACVCVQHTTARSTVPRAERNEPNRQ